MNACPSWCGKTITQGTPPGFMNYPGHTGDWRVWHTEECRAKDVGDIQANLIAAQDRSDRECLDRILAGTDRE